MKTDKMVPIEIDLHHEMKVYCVKNHLIMKRIVEDLMREWLDKQKKGTEVPNEMK
jgi:hypothetical protein